MSTFKCKSKLLKQIENREIKKKIANPEHPSVEKVFECSI